MLELNILGRTCLPIRATFIIRLRIREMLGENVSRKMGKRTVQPEGRENVVRLTSSNGLLARQAARHYEASFVTNARAGFAASARANFICCQS